MAKFLRTRGKSFLNFLAISELPLLFKRPRNVWREADKVDGQKTT